MTRRTTDYAIITHAMELLRSGVLASALPEKLMSEYGLSPERAGELASRAIEIYIKPGRRGQAGYQAV